VPEGIVATVSHQRIVVEPDESAVFAVRVEVPDNARSGQYRITITADALDDEGGVGTSESYPVFVEVKNVVEAMGIGWTVALVAGTAVACVASLYVLGRRGKLGRVGGWFARRRGGTAGGEVG
jgi:uncharacterized membrane protein